MLSVIIPARNEVYLEKTIRSVLEAARGQIEVIVLLDGYLPDPPIITNDPRVIFYHYQESIGQRAAINAGVQRAHGEYIMKLDAHCSVDEGFDVKLAADCEYDWTVVPRMYNLDIETWTPKLHKRTDYMYIGHGEDRILRAEYYRRQPRNDKMIDDVMCCMGPGWFMHKERFLELGGCDEGHGGWGQQGVEVALKAWLSGGSLKVNKKTWFAHWFRGGNPGFPYHISGRAIESARTYSRDLWLNDRWDKAVRKLDWLIEKFDPPGWETKAMEEKIDELNRVFYREVHLRRGDPTWRGVHIVKLPTDMIMYQQAIWAKKPDFIIDCGTRFGGSALFYADMLEMTGKGQVVSIDIIKRDWPVHPRVQYLTGPTTSAEILAQVRSIVGNGTCMAILDSDHSRAHVKRELYYYGPIVTPGQFMVAEDCYDKDAKIAGPGEAVDWFLRMKKGFKRETPEKQYLVAFTRGGWLRKL
jgi:cephalosporin hydroxylase